MPCNDGGGPGFGRTEYVYRDNPKVAAILCAIIRKHGVEILKALDYAEAGVSYSEAVAWWKAHEKRDSERKAREVEAAQREERIRRAKSKLSPEERKLLGLK